MISYNCDTISVYENQKAIILSKKDASRTSKYRFNFVYIKDDVIKEKLLDHSYDSNKVGDTIIIKRFIRCETIK